LLAGTDASSPDTEEVHQWVVPGDVVQECSKAASGSACAIAMLQLLPALYVTGAQRYTPAQVHGLRISAWKPIGPSEAETRGGCWPDL
jgi:hypothetical protein